MAQPAIQEPCLPCPCRVTLMTFNVWGGAEGVPPLWPQRAGALDALLRRYTPDVLCAQELCPLTASVVHRLVMILEWCTLAMGTRWIVCMHALSSAIADHMLT